MKVAALAGGVGAAKFLRGLVLANPPGDLTLIGNTGDDAIIHGLYVCPDLDIACYTLAGLAGEQGWGLKGDTTRALDQMRSYGAPAWFALGDRDLGTHLARTAWLSQGLSLSEVTDRIRVALGVQVKVLPMSDQPVSTKLTTTDGLERDFQEYFVKYGHREDIAAVRFEGAETSRPAPGVVDALNKADRIIVCPSNPVLSIGPILAVPAIRDSIRAKKADVFAISPIVQGRALRGPAAKLLPLWGAEPSAFGVAELYADICGNFVLDRLDTHQADRIRALGMRVLVVDTVMTSEKVARQIAQEILFPPRPALSPPQDDLTMRSRQ